PSAPAAGTVGLAWHGDGQEPHGYPLVVSGSSATATIYHFSGAGAGALPPLAPIDECTSEADMEAGVGAALQGAETGDTGARDLFTDVLRNCYRNLVVPALQMSGGGSFRNAASYAREVYDRWLGAVTLLATGFFPDFTLEPELDQSRPLAAAL